MADSTTDIPEDLLKQLAEAGSNELKEVSKLRETLKSGAEKLEEYIDNAPDRHTQTAIIHMLHKVNVVRLKIDNVVEAVQTRNDAISYQLAKHIHRRAKHEIELMLQRYDALARRRNPQEAKETPHKPESKSD